MKWHDGTPFTSADVKFSFEEVLLKFHARTKASMGGVLAGIETPDDRTVVFRFKHPYAPLLYQLDVTEAPIVAKHIYQNTDPQTNPANASPVGTGPFKFVSYKKGAEIRLARNPTYFKKGMPYLDGLVMRIIPGPVDPGAGARERRDRLPVGGARPAAEPARRRCARPHGPDRVQPRRVQLHHDGQLQPRPPDPEGARGSAARSPTRSTASRS